MFQKIRNFIGLLLVTSLLTYFVMWAIVESVPEPKPLGYKLAPTDEEMKEINSDY